MSRRVTRAASRALPIAVIGLGLGLAALAAADPTPLLGGRSAKFRAFVVPSRNNAAITISGDTSLAPLTDPIACPADPKVRIRASDGYDTGEITLPCALWRRSGSGFKYADKLAARSGVHSVVYGKKRLVIKLRGTAYPPLIGGLPSPAAVEVSFSTGGREYCARFTTFRRNEPGNIAATKPSIACLPPPATPTPAPTATPTAAPTPTPTPLPVVVQCPAGATCEAFDIVPGFGVLQPPDDGASTWLRIFDFTGVGLFGNATNGRFGPSPVVLAKGASGPGGAAPLDFVDTTYLGANLLDAAQDLGSPGTICVEVAPDALRAGWIDCDGGTDADAELVVDSRGPDPADSPAFSAPGATDPLAPAGAALVPVNLRLLIVPYNDAPCATLDYSGSPVIPAAFTTGVAQSTVLNDWIGGAAGTAGTNTVALAGQPLACAGWGSGSGALASIVAPLYALDFPAPIVGMTVDVSQAFRLQLQSRPLPTPTPPGVTPTPAASPTPTATPSPAPTATPSPTPSPAPTPTSTPPPTPTPYLTSIPAQITGLSIGNTSTTIEQQYVALGNCYRAARTGQAVLSESAGAFQTRVQQSVATDCEAVPTGGGGVMASASGHYTVSFGVTCPAGSTTTIQVATALRGAHTINRDNFDGCDLPFFGSTGTSQANLSAIVGSLSGGSLAGGSLHLDAPPLLTGADDANSPFARSSTATIQGTGTGGAVAHSLTFDWSASCSSNGDSTDTGSECAVRLGLDADLSPNGIAGCMDADDYPGVGSRNAADDGHFVSVTATCTVLVAAPTPTPVATATPVATPTPVPTATPPPAPLGPLSFTVATGSSSYCPADATAGSLLKTHGNPTGGFPGTVCSGTKGAFTSGPLQLEGGLPDVFGRAALMLASPVVIGANLDSQTPNCGSSCGACWRFADDPSRTGFVDCDGGSNADQTLIVNSAGTSAPPAPFFDVAWSSVQSGAGDDGPGAAVIPVLVKRMRVNGTTSCPGPSDPAWTSVATETLALVTGQAVSRIDSPRRCTGDLFGTACPSANPFTASLVGTNFSCSAWPSGGGGARLVIPFVSLDEDLGSSFGTGDIAQVLRLND